MSLKINTACAVCLNTFGSAEETNEMSDTTKKILECGHILHKQCDRPELRRCPVCSKPIQGRVKLYKKSDVEAIAWQFSRQACPVMLNSFIEKHVIEKLTPFIDKPLDDWGVDPIGTMKLLCRVFEVSQDLDLSSPLNRLTFQEGTAEYQIVAEAVESLESVISLQQEQEIDIFHEPDYEELFKSKIVNAIHIKANHMRDLILKDLPEDGFHSRTKEWFDQLSEMKSNFFIAILLEKPTLVDQLFKDRKERFIHQFEKTFSSYPQGERFGQLINYLVYCKVREVVNKIPLYKEILHNEALRKRNKARKIAVGAVVGVAGLVAAIATYVF